MNDQDLNIVNKVLNDIAVETENALDEIEEDIDQLIMNISSENSK